MFSIPRLKGYHPKEITEHKSENLDELEILVQRVLFEVADQEQQKETYQVKSRESYSDAV
jgi:hypothetical protein